MKREIVKALFERFEKLALKEGVVEYWLARELQDELGYATWESFAKVIEKAGVACKNSGQPTQNHFREVTKMVGIGSSAQREISDFALTRYACYLIAQNGDPRKEPIAFAQTYFAVQTRRQEIVEKRLEEVERVKAREKLTNSENVLSGIVFERIRDGAGVARIRSKGDEALFGGFTTQDMKKKLAVPANRALSDFLPTITIKAKDFANEITSFSIKRDDLRSEPALTNEHVKNNRDVRELLKQRGIKPEALPREEDVKKVERRLTSEGKKLPKQTKSK